MPLAKAQSPEALRKDTRCEEGVGGDLVGEQGGSRGGGVVLVKENSDELRLHLKEEA